jgi:hypothetical protein
MRSLLTGLVGSMLACSGEGQVYHETLPQPAAVDDLRSVSEQRTLDLESGLIRWQFEVGALTKSFALYIEGVTGAEYLIDELEGPDGVLVRSRASSDEAASGLGAAAAPFFSANRSVGDHGGASLLVPNDPRLKVTPGTWSARLRSTRTEPHSVRLTRIEQHASARPAVVRIPLNVHLSGAGGITRDNAQTHPRLRRAMQRIQSIFSPANIELSPINYWELDEGFQVLEDVTLRDDQSLEMLQSSSTSDGINLFLIERFEPADDLLGTVGGVSAAIPGDPRAGERFAGVVVATSFSDDTPEDDLLGLTAAHEIGHFLGLFHTSEAAGFEDPLEDTEGATEDNLMHHLSRSGRDQLTEHQGMVLRAHPAAVLP